MNTQTHSATDLTQTGRKAALFSYEDSNGETAYFTHAELVSLRNRYIKAHPKQKHDVFEDETLFDSSGDSDMRQQLADWDMENQEL